MKARVFGEEAHVVLEGELDIFRQGDMAAALPDPSAIGGATIDLSRATYLDSVAIGMLVGFRRSFVTAGGDPQKIVLILPNAGPVHRTFEICGLTRLFPVAYADPKDSGVSVPSPS
ncbi:MAG: STAS domain-containing protein [Candidatus Eremiobacteraeota bacterium]|nr:STAS domain-containing protein [Candidatus Eremiobacteraeota bacterium]MBV8283090.1 STAS domain-containing protein [Candidatus Eremiobacteraeota bacterium]MBV8434455.1 STAS domain-containing protein [Candidatus Eremiobacteraeota bacterium]